MLLINAMTSSFPPYTLKQISFPSTPSKNVRIVVSINPRMKADSFIDIFRKETYAMCNHRSQLHKIHHLSFFRSSIMKDGYSLLMKRFAHKFSSLKRYVIDYLSKYNTPQPLIAVISDWGVIGI